MNIPAKRPRDPRLRPIHPILPPSPPLTAADRVKVRVISAKNKARLFSLSGSESDEEVHFKQNQLKIDAKLFIQADKKINFCKLNLTKKIDQTQKQLFKSEISKKRVLYYLKIQLLARKYKWRLHKTPELNLRIRTKLLDKLLRKPVSGDRIIFKKPDLKIGLACICLLYTSPSPRDRQKSRMPSSA